jgi:hypothetical protein
MAQQLRGNHHVINDLGHACVSENADPPGRLTRLSFDRAVAGD